VRVQPRAARDGLAGWRQGALSVRVSAPPVDGEANHAVLTLLATALGVRPSALKVDRGQRGRDKLIRVEGLSRVEIEARLGRTARRRAMRTKIVAAGLLLATLSDGSSAALAEHNSAVPSDPGRSTDLDLGLRLGRDGFSLGGRVFGLEGVYGAWLNGQVSREGFTVDGRVQNPDRSWNFRFSADVWDWLFH
jgi:uncharacterized protein (TIGR00251 family)